MNTDSPVTWWPQAQLLRAPIQRVFVCGRKLHPPIYSHMVNFPRLEFPVQGCYKSQIESDGEVITVQLKPGDALFAAPNCWNFPEWQQGLELISLLFGVKQIGLSMVTAQRRRLEPQLAARKFSIPRPLTGPLPHLVDAMVALQASNSNSKMFPDLARALVTNIGELLKQPHEQVASRTQALLEIICVFLQNHYQYDISRDSVAQQFNISPTHLSRLFQTHGHMTFSNYLTYVRIDRAKHLLRSYNFKLDEIAERCGYHNTPYFCQTFKRFTKSTPAEYRAKARVG
jgi:AraC-like DNA-binding protein